MLDKLFKFLKEPIEGFIYLIFPRYCIACGEELTDEENYLCSSCLFELKSMEKNESVINELNKRLEYPKWLKYAYSFIAFDEKVQNMIHEIKYQGNFKFAIYLGEILGEFLRDNQLFSDIDLIVPVPLHPKKLKKRGYNQATMLAKGIVKYLQVPIAEQAVIRTVNTKTQTKLSAEERRRNVKGIFAVKHTQELKGKHILILDDVITTGSTVLELANTIASTIDKVEISILTFAYAD